MVKAIDRCCRTLYPKSGEARCAPACDRALARRLWRQRAAGTLVNHKRVYRLYRQEGLQLPRRRRKYLRSVRRQPLTPALGVNARWSMDFMSDAFADGRKCHVLNVIDDFSRERLTIEVGAVIVTDNGPEFRGGAMDAWACRKPR